MTYLYSLLIIGIGAVISLYEVPRLLQPETRGELMAFAGFLIIGMALSIALTLHWPVPNPTNIIMILFNPLTSWVYPD